MILPCGVSRAPNRAEAGPQQRHVRGDQAVEKVAGVVAADLDHAPVGKKRCFHAEISCDMLQRNVSRHAMNDKACARMADPRQRAADDRNARRRSGLRGIKD